MGEIEGAEHGVSCQCLLVEVLNPKWTPVKREDATHQFPVSVRSPDGCSSSMQPARQ